jgi:16S rRNA (uracil1498-N3)-methyltransferase
MQRFLIDPDLPTREKPRLTGSEARHALRVLRLQPGDSLILTDAQGHEWQAVITEASNDEAGLQIIRESAPLEEPRLELTLGLALIKADRFDLVVQKGTELGLKTLVPLNSSHSVVNSRSAQSAQKLARWKEIARQSLKQCRRAFPVNVEPVKNIGDFIASASGADLKIMLHQGDPNSGGMTWRELADNYQNPGSICAMVGPEGGFASSEVAEAREAGFEILGLGPRTMRSETAALALCSILGFLWGDLSNFH